METLIAFLVGMSLVWLPSSQVTYTASPVEPSELPYELKRICSCESSYEGNAESEPQQFEKDGSVRRGVVNPDDIGQCQINLFYHGERATSLGINLFTREGNAEYATLLYEEQGAKPWSWSRDCHGYW